MTANVDQARRTQVGKDKTSVRGGDKSKRRPASGRSVVASAEGGRRKFRIGQAAMCNSVALGGARCPRVV